MRCTAGAVAHAGVWYGPGSAERHEECRAASGTRLLTSSLPGLTRQSILERLLAKKMDTRVKPAYDEV